MNFATARCHVASVARLMRDKKLLTCRRRGKRKHLKGNIYEFFPDNFVFRREKRTIRVGFENNQQRNLKLFDKNHESLGLCVAPGRGNTLEL